MYLSVKGLCIALLLLLSSWGFAVSYTVQVIAVSTQAIAAKLQEQLNDEGYEAYLVRVPTSDGPVFRIRVGAFANRAAAAVFADAMQGVLDSNPTPALADGIPSGLVPLEAELVGKYSTLANDFEVLPWQGEVAFRVQAKNQQEQASYRVVDIVEFDAWQAAPRSDGTIIRVYSHHLWPEAWKIRTSTELELDRQRGMNELSQVLNLTVDQLEGFQFTSSEGIPYLVLVEVFEPRSKEGQILRVLGQPASGLGKFGPELVWFEDEVAISTPRTSFIPDLSQESQSSNFDSRDGWQASQDNSFTEIYHDASEKVWRAAVGRPLWVRENWLIAGSGRDILLYKLQKR